jgi:hypothetical protein
MFGSQMDTPNGNIFIHPTKAGPCCTSTRVIFPVLLIEPSSPRANALQQTSPIKGAACSPPTFYKQHRKKVPVDTTGLAHRPFAKNRTLRMIFLITTAIANLSLWACEKRGHLVTELLRQE